MAKIAFGHGSQRFLFTFLGLALTCTAECAVEKSSVTWDASLAIGGVSAGSQAGLSALLTRKWQVEDEVITFDVRNDKRQEMIVGSCDALFRADAANMQPTAYADFKQYRAWATGCYSVRAVSQASGAKQSFVSGFAMDESHVRQLPVGLAFVISKDESREVQRIDAAGGSLGDYMGAALITAAKDSPARGVVIKDDSGGTEGLRWLASGDFDNDGNEDLLISTYSSVTDGSYESWGLYLVSREHEHAPMKLLKTYPVMGVGEAR